MLMLRLCVRGAQQRRWQLYCSSLASSSLDYDSSSCACAHRRNHQHQLPVTMAAHHRFSKRCFGISRYPDPLEKHGNINSIDDDDIDIMATADDLDYGEIEEESNVMSRKMNAMSAWRDDDGDDDGSDLFDKSFFGKGRRDDHDDVDDDNTPLDEDTIADAAFHERQQKIKQELDQRTGRLWTDEWIITDEEWLSNETFDDIEEWKPELATRKSLESVKVFDGGVPTLRQLSELSLPPSLASHPGHGSPKSYATRRKKTIRSRLRMAIQLSIHDDLQKILKMESWSDKQEAVDTLFEVIEERVREKEPVLAQLPEFGSMVENGLEQVLRMVQGRMRGAAKVNAGNESSTREDSDSIVGENIATTKDNKDDILDVAGASDEVITPVFMDIANVKNPPNSDFLAKSNDAGIPNLIYPLNVHHREGVGRMVEEWELAANKETKRIMMRDAMKAIATKIVDATNCCGKAVSDSEKGAARVFVTGKRGVGKTAALAGIVASARISGHVVVYLPDGNRLRKHGFYVEPCNYRKGLFHLPLIAQEFCEQLLKSHGGDINTMTASDETMKKFLTDDQITKVLSKGKEECSEIETSLTLDKLLYVGSESASLSSGCYLSVISTLMNQTEKPFTVVMDDFNCYYDHGHYFHMDYDENVEKAIPLNKISIFKPFLDAMGLYPVTAGNAISRDDAIDSSQAMMKWGSIVAAVSESKAVRSTFTKSLTESAYSLGQDEKHPVHVLDVRRYNNVEVQHILYNFEIIGIGRLRFDRGNTTLNPEEVEYLRMVSGGTGQHLMDACMLP